MDADALVSATFSRVPGVRLAGVIDMATGMFLAVQAGTAPPEELDLLAVSAREVFDGLSAAGLRRSFIEANDEQRLREVIVVGDKTIFVFARVALQDETTLVVACDKKAQLGMITMVLAKIRASAEAD